MSKRIWTPRRTFVICGVTFKSGGDGHYYSEGGRYAIYHMMQGRADACWELHTIDRETTTIDFIDSAPTLGEVVWHGGKGWFKLEAEQ